MGNLTDDAWLQYPTQLTSRHMVYLDSDDYIHSVKPQGGKKIQEAGSNPTVGRSESSASEEIKVQDSSTCKDLPPNTDAKNKMPENASQISSDQGINQFKSSQNSFEQHDSALEYNSHVPEQCQHYDSSLRKSDQRQGITEMTEESQHVQETSLPDAPDTPSDKTETKVSSDEGIEVLGSPASTGSDGKPVDDIHDNKSLTDEEVPVRDDETTIISSSPRHSTTGTGYQEEECQETAVPMFKIGDDVGCMERSEECQDSSSDASSETEPSTIVYVDEFSTDSLLEGQKSSLMDNEGDREGQSKVQQSTEGQNITEKGNRDQNKFYGNPDLGNCEMMGDDKKKLNQQDSVPVQVTSPHKVSGELYEKLSEKTLTSNTQTTEGLKQKMGVTDRITHSPITVTQRPCDKQYSRESLSEVDAYDSEDECLVVQVYGDKSIISQSEGTCDVSEVGDGNAEFRTEEEVVKIVPHRRDESKGDLTGGHSMELMSNKPDDITSQVLTLLRMKQQQELEELRQRQEEEVQQFMRQLQRVSPEQLRAFLSASHTIVKSSDISVRDDHSSVLSHAAVQPGSPSAARLSIENNGTESESNYMRSETNTEICNDENDKSYDSDHKVTSGARVHVQSSDMPEDVSPVIPLYTQSERQLGHRSSPFPTTVQSCPSSRPLVNSHSPAVSISSASAQPSGICTEVDVETKPLPSNHTNIMPSYFMNEDARKSPNHSEVSYMPYSEVYLSSSKNLPPQVSHSPRHITHSGSSVDNSGSGRVDYCHTRNDNSDQESGETRSFINGNYVNYGDSMQYYRLCTPDEDITVSVTDPPTSDVEAHHRQSSHTEMVTQPGLFKVTNNGSWPSPRPTSITSLLAEHPELFREEVVEVDLEGSGDWMIAESKQRDTQHMGQATECISSSVMVHQARGTAEGGLDMVPERDSTANIKFYRLVCKNVFCY